MGSHNDKNEPVDLAALWLDTDAARIAEETVATDIAPPRRHHPDIQVPLCRVFLESTQARHEATGHGLLPHPPVLISMRIIRQA